jgi:hypothetical protein
MTEDDKTALRNWMSGGYSGDPKRSLSYIGYSGDPKRSLSYIINGLAEIAAKKAASFAAEPDGFESKAHRINQRQWERIIPRLEELADWIKEFGPDSGCR